MPDPPAAPDVHDPYLAFRHPIYRRFALSYVLAVVSSQILSTAVQWEVYSLTSDPLSLGWLGGLNALPLLLLSQIGRAHV